MLTYTTEDFVNLAADFDALLELLRDLVGDFPAGVRSNALDAARALLTRVDDDLAEYDGIDGGET